MIFTDSFYAETSRNYDSQTNNSFIDQPIKTPVTPKEDNRVIYEPKMTSVDRQKYSKN